MKMLNQNTTMKKSLVKKLLITGAVAILIGIGYVVYLLNMPHRDVQSVKAFVEIESRLLVQEFLNDSDAANAKYLAEDGESKVIIVKGPIDAIFEDQKNQKVIVLKDKEEKVGVSSTFMPETNANVQGLQIGEYIKIKGVIRSGAEIDKDLELYEDVIIEKSDIIL